MLRFGETLLGLVGLTLLAGCPAPSGFPNKPIGDAPRMQPVGMPADAEWVVRDDFEGVVNVWAWPRRGPVARTWFYFLDQEACELTEGEVEVVAEAEYCPWLIPSAGGVVAVPPGDQMLVFAIAPIRKRRDGLRYEFFPVEVEFDAEHDRLFLIERPGRWPPVTARDQRVAERAFRRSQQCWASGRIEVRPQEAREEVYCLLHP